MSKVTSTFSENLEKVTLILKRTWKSERVKSKLFHEIIASLKFSFGQGDSRKSDFARPYWKFYWSKFPQIGDSKMQEQFFLTCQYFLSYDAKLNEPCNISSKLFETIVKNFQQSNTVGKRSFCNGSWMCLQNVTSSFCSFARVADSFLLRRITKHAQAWYRYLCFKRYSKMIAKHQWQVLFNKSCGITDLLKRKSKRRFAKVVICSIKR